MQTVDSISQGVSPKFVGWAALALFVLWLLAIGVAIAQMSVFPDFSDQYIPAKIEAIILIATLNRLLQPAIGTALIALALPLSYDLSTPLNMTMRFALAAGVHGGGFLVSAGAGGQENVFESEFFTKEQASGFASVSGTSDLTVINATNSLVAGGLRSTAAYGTGWAMMLWSITALKAKRSPDALLASPLIGSTAPLVSHAPFKPISFRYSSHWCQFKGRRIVNKLAFLTT